MAEVNEGFSFEGLLSYLRRLARAFSADFPTVGCSESMLARC